MTQIAEQLQVALRRLTIATIVLYVMLLIVVVYVYVDSSQKADDLANTTAQTNKSLCTFRDDIGQRIQQTTQFLATHPHGIPGISNQTLQQSEVQQERTYKALRGLNCPTPPLP